MSTGLALPDPAHARLPEKYVAATKAIAECSSVDECKTWADKAMAIASYARQADDQTLENHAARIKARAIQRCGELLKAFDAQGARTDLDGQPGRGTPTKLTQARAASNAGLSKDQQVQAVRVANIPKEEFEVLVESDDPPTVTALAERGKKTRGKQRTRHAPRPWSFDDYLARTRMYVEMSVPVVPEKYRARFVEAFHQIIDEVYGGL